MQGRFPEIVSSSPSGSIKRRSDQDWRAFHLEWFDHHKISKRGYDSSASWWRNRFDSLLNGNHGYGIARTYPFSQILYHAAKECQPYGTVGLDVSVEGHLAARLDFGISVIGTLRDFDFSESYAYFNLHDLEFKTTMNIDGRAGLQYQSQLLQLRTFSPLPQSGKEDQRAFYRRLCDEKFD